MPQKVTNISSAYPNAHNAHHKLTSHILLKEVIVKFSMKRFQQSTTVLIGTVTLHALTARGLMEPLSH